MTVKEINPFVSSLTIRIPINSFIEWNDFLFYINFPFFFLLDTNGDDFLDTSELEALFIKEVSCNAAIQFKFSDYMCTYVLHG